MNVKLGQQIENEILIKVKASKESISLKIVQLII